MTAWLDRVFHLSAHRTTVRTEVVAGATTFLTMSYIVFVQPAVLGAAGMDEGAVLAATCLASALGTLLMALLANYPIGVAPAMGHNFFFAFTVVVAGGTPWPVALGAVAIAGLVFILTAGVGLRERVMHAVPDPIKHAIAAGIGLLIAFIGLQWSGIVVAHPGTLVGISQLGSAPALLALGTTAVMAVLWARRVPGALLLGMLASSLVALAMGLARFEGVVAAPPSLAPTFLKLDILGALRPELLGVTLVFFLLALFDSIGTLIGVGTQMGAVRNGTMPRAKQALLADAAGTVAGAALGTSTVTAYIESSTGVSAGGRTGLTAVVVAALFLLALFFQPLVRMIGGGYAAGDGRILYPSVAPALVLVGVMMMRAVRDIRWDDATDAIPAFLTIVIMPFAVSITEGIGFGLIAIALLKVATGRGRELHPLAYVFGAVFLLKDVL
jgi:AGZA family xanthine/uracil permease-like MFS transporter